MAPHSSTLAWKIPWMEEPGRLQSTGLDTSERLPFPFPFHYFKGTEGLGKLYTHDVLKKKATIQEEVKELTDRELVSPSQLSPQLGVAPTALQNVIQRVLAQSREKCATQRETEVYQKKSE